MLYRRYVKQAHMHTYRHLPTETILRNQVCHVPGLKIKMVAIVWGVCVEDLLYNSKLLWQKTAVISLQNKYFVIKLS